MENDFNSFMSRLENIKFDLNNKLEVLAFDNYRAPLFGIEATFDFPKIKMYLN